MDKPKPGFLVRPETENASEATFPWETSPLAPPHIQPELSLRAASGFRTLSEHFFAFTKNMPKLVFILDTPNGRMKKIDFGAEQKTFQSMHF